MLTQRGTQQGQRRDYKQGQERCRQRQKMAEGSWWVLSPGARLPRLALEPSASMSTPRIMLCFMPQTRGERHLSEEVVAL